MLVIRVNEPEIDYETNPLHNNRCVFVVERVGMGGYRIYSRVSQYNLHEGTWRAEYFEKNFKRLSPR